MYLDFVNFMIPPCNTLETIYCFYLVITTHQDMSFFYIDKHKRTWETLEMLIWFDTFSLTLC